MGRMRGALAAVAVASACVSCLFDLPEVQSDAAGAQGDDASTASLDGTSPGVGAVNSSSGSGGNAGSGSGSSSTGGSTSSSSSGGSGSSGAGEGGIADAGPGSDAACTGVLCKCSVATDCSTRICAESLTVGQSLYSAAGGKFCTRPCCTSSDCDNGTVCFATGQGGNYCADPAWLGRAAPAGSLVGGASCGTSAQCRSGLCQAGACADTCCSFAGSGVECAGGTSCTFASFPGKGFDTHFAPSCSSHTGSGGLGAPCLSGSECQGGLCLQSMCTRPCRNSAECGANGACQLGVQGNDVVATCFPWVPNGPQGSSCNSNSDCQGAWCLSNRCTNICFTDAECISGWHCTPQPDAVPSGNGLVLACGPP
jgi:hypothetical protein